MFSRSSAEYLRSLGPLQTHELTMGPLSSAEIHTAFKFNLQGTNFLSSLIRHASQVADFLNDRIALHRPVRTVVYPASGYDAATGFLIFPQATVVIGIDTLPFVQSNVDRIPTRIPMDMQNSVVRRSDVQEYARENDMASAIVGRLEVSIPHFRLLQVVSAVSEGGIHGWVKFDTGPGTLVRRYIHLDSEIPSASGWLSGLIGQGYDAVVIKGGVNLSHAAETATLVDYLRREGGVIIDSDWILPESQQASHRPGTHVYPTHIPLGYRMAKIVEFKR